MQHSDTIALFTRNSPISRAININGKDCNGVVKQLGWEEMKGYRIEIGMLALRITVVKEDIDFVPARGTEVEVDDQFYDIEEVKDLRTCWRIVFKRPVP